MKIAHIAFAALLVLGSCSEDSNKIVDLRDSQPNDKSKASTSKDEPGSEETKKSEWTYKVVIVSEGNWGYQLFDRGTMVINQTTIPALQGILGFESKEKADKTARFVLEKINRGEFPPTVSLEELEKLKVLRAEN